ncbi:MAG TPA: DUF885 domain-containing protein, partial [Usitatibacter sp.]|nr:DUF885 domain-containing protein [Usitatibacter sp.]
MKIAAAVFAFAAGCAIAAEPAPNKALAALFDREFKRGLDEHPEQATFLGIPGYDDRLTDISDAAVARRKAHVKEVAAELRKFDPKTLNTQDRISRAILLDSTELEMQQDALFGALPFSEEDGWLPVSSMNGPQNGYPYLARATQFRKSADVANYVKRLDGIPTRLEQMMARMRMGMKSGWMPPRAAMGQVPGMFDAFVMEDVTRSPLWAPFTQLPPDMPAGERDKWTAEGKRAMAGVRAGFAKVQKFLVDEYIPAARNELGASSLPAGPAYYALQVREKTTTALTPAEIHEIGLSEVARIRKAMDEVIATTDFKGTFPEFLKFINT